jgi:hypothetical protein
MSSPVVQGVPVGLIDKHYHRFNSNNHWPNDVRPADYDEVLAAGDTSRWVDAFHPVYTTATIEAADVAWMHEASRVGHHTGRVSLLHADQLADFAARFAHVDAQMAVGVFVRTDRVSLKNGVHGAGPYTSMRQIAESLVTSMPRHDPLRTDPPIRLFFLPWVEMDHSLEFRVFVHRGRVTAVSQQRWEEANAHMAALPPASRPAEAARWVRLIDEATRTEIVPRLHPLASFVMDVALIDGGSRVYFIEPNSFGAAYAAGSALFHWEHDAAVLEGGGPVVVRYVDPDDAEPDAALEALDNAGSVTQAGTSD